MKTVITMTLNPCIDKTIYVTSWEKGKTNHVNRTLEQVAGKGINVAFALKGLGIPVKAMGFSFKEDDGNVKNALNSEGIPFEFVTVPGKLRMNEKIFEESTCTMTELNESGQTVDGRYVDAVMEKLKAVLPKAAVLVLTGSVPPGVEKNIYGRMILAAKEFAVPVILDATKELLLEGIKEIPFMIKPNKEEFETAFLEGKDATEEELINKAKEIVNTGVEYVCISLGEEGALLVSKTGVEKRSALKVPVRSLQGAGDSMVAGFCKALLENKKGQLLHYATICAAATVSLEGTKMVDLEGFQKLL